MDKRNTDLEQIREFLLAAAGPVYITSHPFPDGDSIGSTVGLYHYLTARGVQAFPVLPGPVPEVYEFLVSGLELLHPPLNVQGEIVVVLDCSDLKRLQDWGQLLAEAAWVINIDHHLNNDFFGDMNYVDPSAAAVGQILHNMFAATQYSQAVAQALFTALFTDTGRFSFSNTDVSVLRAGARMVELGASPSGVFNSVYQNRSGNYYYFLSEALAKIERLFEGRVAVLPLERELPAKYGLEEWELDDLNDYPRSLKGVILSVVLKETEDNGIKVSLRSTGQLNVAAIAKDLGGGGHHNAAGATLPLSMAEAKAKLACRLAEEFEQ